MPKEQVEEFNRYIRLMNAANSDLGMLVLLLKEMVERLDVRFAWLLSLRMWQLYTEQIASYIDRCAKEPITESEHQKRLESATTKLVSQSDIQFALALRTEGYFAEIIKPLFEGSESSDEEALEAINNQVSEQVQRFTGERPDALTRKGKRTLYREAVFYEWLGEPLPVQPDWGYGYDVLTEDEDNAVSRLRKQRAELRRMLERVSPGCTGMGDRPKKRRSEKDGWPPMSDLVDNIKQRLIEALQLRWAELRWVEIVWDEISTEFDSEPVIRPNVRDLLDDAKRRVTEIVNWLTELCSVDIELGEPPDDLLGITRQALRQD